MRTESHPKVELSHVIEAYGGRQAMADCLGSLTRQAIEQWTEVPVRWVLRIETDTGYSRHQLRPDVYGPYPVMVEPRQAHA